MCASFFVIQKKKICPLAVFNKWHLKLIIWHGIEPCFFLLKLSKWNDKVISKRIERNWNDRCKGVSCLKTKNPRPKPCIFNYGCCNFHVCLAFINQLFKYLMRKRSSITKGKTKQNKKNNETKIIHIYFIDYILSYYIQ